MITVKATREGLIGGTLASGILATVHLPFVALPSTLALYKFVRVTNAATKTSVVAVVLDVGPWNTHDDGYVFHGQRPASERGIDVSGNGKTNGSGIDLSDAVWSALGMTDNTDVSWEFLV
jgi:hypothetical protein